jgi:hypothetical protein
MFLEIYQKPSKLIALSAISNFRENRAFEKLSQVSNNIQVDVVRTGGRVGINRFQFLKLWLEMSFAWRLELKFRQVGYS